MAPRPALSPRIWPVPIQRARPQQRWHSVTGADAAESLCLLEGDHFQMAFSGMAFTGSLDLVPAGYHLKTNRSHTLDLRLMDAPFESHLLPHFSCDVALGAIKTSSHLIPSWAAFSQDCLCARYDSYRPPQQSKPELWRSLVCRPLQLPRELHITFPPPQLVRNEESVSTVGACVPSMPQLSTPDLVETAPVVPAGESWRQAALEVRGVSLEMMAHSFQALPDCEERAKVLALLAGIEARFQSSVPGAWCSLMHEAITLIQGMQQNGSEPYLLVQPDTQVRHTPSVRTQAAETLSIDDDIQIGTSAPVPEETRLFSSSLDLGESSPLSHRGERTPPLSPSSPASMLPPPSPPRMAVPMTPATCASFSLGPSPPSPPLATCSLQAADEAKVTPLSTCTSRSATSTASPGAKGESEPSSKGPLNKVTYETFCKELAARKFTLPAVRVQQHHPAARSGGRGDFTQRQELPNSKTSSPKASSATAVCEDSTPDPSATAQLPTIQLEQSSPPSCPAAQIVSTTASSSQPATPCTTGKRALGGTLKEPRRKRRALSRSTVQQDESMDEDSIPLTALGMAKEKGLTPRSNGQSGADKCTASPQYVQRDEQSAQIQPSQGCVGQSSTELVWSSSLFKRHLRCWLRSVQLSREFTDA